MKRSFVVTLSAAGASGLVGMGCAGSALGGLKDGDDDGRPRAPVAGGTAQQPNVSPFPMNPPFVDNRPKPQPPPIPQPQPAGRAGTSVPIAGYGGSYNPPAPCLQVPVHGAWCSFEITCEFPPQDPCQVGKRAICSGNTWYVSDMHVCCCDPPDADAGTAFE